MDLRNFNAVVDDQLNAIRDILINKGDEYVPGEAKSRFHNFDVGAAFNGQTNTETLWGYLTKHLVSLSDMVKGDSTQHEMEKWSEKLGDAITYLVLLRAMVEHNGKDDAIEALREKLGGPSKYADPHPPAGSTQIAHHTSEGGPHPAHIVVGGETDVQIHNRQALNETLQTLPNRPTY